MRSTALDRGDVQGELRHAYRRQVALLEDEVLAMGEEALHMLGRAVAALIDDDPESAGAVVRADDELDAGFQRVQLGVFAVLARQAPVAGDLRFLSGLLHTNIHVERMGDLAVNIARLVPEVHGLPGDPDLLAQLQEMATHATRVARHSLGAFTRRDADAAAELPAMDEPLDRLNHGIFRLLVELAAADRDQLDWAMRMVLAARFLERLADHAVDIGEQTIFVVTGQTADL